MPGLNGTGPQGKGSKTGRGMGNCNPKNSDNISSDIGSGRGRGCGRGRGFGRSDNYSLQEEKEMLEARLDVINKNLEEENK